MEIRTVIFSVLASCAMLLNLACSDRSAERKAHREQSAKQAKAISKLNDEIKSKNEELLKYRRDMLSAAVALAANALSNGGVANLISDRTIKMVVDTRLRDFRDGEIDLHYIGKYQRSVVRDVADRMENRYSDKDKLDDTEFSELKLSNWSLRGALREYLASPSRLWGAYEVKRERIGEYIGEGIESKEEKDRLLSYISEIERSFRFTLKRDERAVIEEYFEAEAQVADAVGPARKRMATERFAELEEKLKERTPDLKASTFAYRRYRENGEDLVKAYVQILADVRVVVEDQDIEQRRQGSGENEEK